MATGGLLLKEHIHKHLHSCFVGSHVQSALGKAGIRWVEGMNLYDSDPAQQEHLYSS